METNIVRDRFSALQKQRSFKSVRWLAKAMNINIYSIRKILSGEIRSERDKLLFQAILEKLGMSEDQFFGRAALIQKQSADTKLDSRKIPLYGEIPAGNPTASDGISQPDEWIDPVPGLGNKRVFALRVQGLSMAPRLLPRDVLYLEPLDLHLGPKDPQRPAPKLLFERLHGRIVAVLLDNESTLKVLRVTPKAEDNDYDLHLVPINPAYPEIFIAPHSEVRFQGVVLKSLRDETSPAMSF